MPAQFILEYYYRYNGFVLIRRQQETTPAFLPQNFGSLPTYILYQIFMNEVCSSAPFAATETWSSSF